MSSTGSIGVGAQKSACPTVSLDCGVRAYNVAVALGVTIDLVSNVWDLYSATNPATFVATKFAKKCVKKFADHLLDISAHGVRAAISKDSPWYAKALGVTLDLARIANIVINIKSDPYTSAIPMGASKVDLFNHGVNLAGTAYNEIRKEKPKVT